MRSFFQRESEAKNQPEPATPARSNPVRPRKEAAASGREKTHLARGSKVVGEISGTAELVIDGEVDGQIELQNQVVVGGKGRVDGKIVAASVEVGGKVLGNVRGLERVEVLASGSLEGDVISPRVVIAEGAFFKGKVEMVDGSTKSSGKAKSSAGQADPANPAQGGKSSSGGGHQGGQQRKGNPSAGGHGSPGGHGNRPQQGGRSQHKSSKRHR